MLKITIFHWIVLVQTECCCGWKYWNFNFSCVKFLKNNDKSTLVLVMASRQIGNRTGPLTHWGRMTHICVSKLTIIGSDNGLSPDRRQAIIWTNAGILLIQTLGTNLSDFLCEIRSFSFKKMQLKMSSRKWRLSCLGLNVLNPWKPCSQTHISSGLNELTHWGRDKMDDTLQTTFSNTFYLNENCCILIKISLKFVP